MVTAPSLTTTTWVSLFHPHHPHRWLTVVSCLPVLLGREVDPHTLCPWCDERLPATPSPHLQSLIETARNNSIRNPRPTNPLGLRASVGMFVSVCQRHRPSVSSALASAGELSSIELELDYPTAATSISVSRDTLRSNFRHFQAISSAWLAGWT